MAIYDTGTVTFSGTTVNGSGVNWQTANNPVRPGNTLLVMPANEAFTVVRINSATQLVVNRAPTKAISNSAYCLLLTYALSNDALAQRVSEMTRYYEQQVNAWGQLITASDDVSIIGPDGNAVKIPSLKKLYDGLNGKVDKNATQTQEINGPLLLKGNATLDAGGYCQFRKSVTFNDAVAGKKSITLTGDKNDTSPSLHISQQHTNSSGTVAGGGAYCRLTAQGTEKIFMMSLRQDLNITDYGFLSYRDFRGNWHEVRLQNNGDFNNLTGQWVNGSDIRMKSDLVEIKDPLSLIRGLKLYMGKRDGQPFIGGIAQEIEQRIPLTVSQCGSFKLRTGETIENIKAVDYATLGYVALAALNQAVDRIAELELRVKEIESGLSGKG